jgi:hypothetical protein
VLASALVVVAAPSPPVAAAQPAICTAAHPTVLNGSFEDVALPADGVNTVQATNPDLHWQLAPGQSTIDLYRATSAGDSAAEGVNYADIPAGSYVYQDIDTVPGEPLRWRLSYRSDRSDPLSVELSSPAGTGKVTTQVQASAGWAQTIGADYVVPAGQTVTRLLVRAGTNGHHFLDAVEAQRPAVACDDTATVTTPSGVRIDVLANDLGPDPEIVAVGPVSPPGIGGVLWSPGDINLVFGVAGGASGTATFTYDIKDLNGATATATVTVQVLPRLVGDFATVEAGTPTTVNVLANDRGTQLAVTAITSPPAHGTATITPGGIQYTSDPNYSGGDSLTFEVGGPGLPTTFTSTLTLAVTTTASACAAPRIGLTNGGFEAGSGSYRPGDPAFGWNADGPQGPPSSFEVVPTPLTAGQVPNYRIDATEGTNVLRLQDTSTDPGNLIYQDIATQGGELVYFSFDYGQPTDSLTITFSAGPPGGAPHFTKTVSETQDWQLPYMVWHSISGSFSIPAGQTTTRITLDMEDGFFPDQVGTWLDNVQVGTVTVACDDTATTAAGSPVTVPILANDQGAGLSVSSVGSVSPSAAGTVSSSAGKVTFTPSANFNGTGRAFSGYATLPYTIADNHGGGSDGAMTVQVVPVPIDDQASVLAGRTTSIDVLLNDLGTGIGVAPGPAKPAHGSVVVNGDRIDYTPDPGFRGTDTFTYSLSGTLADPNRTGTVTVTVTGDADLDLSVDPSAPTSALAAQPFTLPFRVQNLPASVLDATAPRVTFTLPAGVALVGGTGCTPASAGPPAIDAFCEANAVTLAAGDSVAFDPQFTSTTEGPIDIQGTVTSSAPDDDTSNNAVTATLTVQASSDISVTGSVSPTPLTGGGTGQVRITVTNNGPSDSSGAVAVVKLAAGIAVGPNPPAGCTATDPTTLTCTITSLPNGQAAVIDIPLVVDPDFSGTASLAVTVTPPIGVTVTGTPALNLDLTVQAQPTTTVPATTSPTGSSPTGSTTTGSTTTGSTTTTTGDGAPTTGAAGTPLATTGRASAGTVGLAMGLLFAGMLLVGGSVGLERRGRRPSQG